jgi:hypothetical protein
MLKAAISSAPPCNAWRKSAPARGDAVARYTELHVDVSEFIDLERTFRQAGPKAPGAIRRAVNRTGAMADTQVVRMLTAQTGLKRKVIRKAVRRVPASAGGMVYILRASGGNVGLKYFGARETRKGVTAAPWGKRRLYPGAFIKGGRFPRRVAIKAYGGAVLYRSDGARLPIKAIKSGLFIPQEMVTGATAAAFKATVRTVLPRRLAHELGRILAK